jgi:sterol desaturase/sphingolipid hydroxylase (fatty acid hydroxylase superfamily)
MVAVLEQFAGRWATIAPFMMAGFVVEFAARRRGDRRSRTVVFNLGTTALFWAFDVVAGAGFTLALTRATDFIPGAGLINVTPRNGATIFLAAFGLTAARDFFYYWFHRLQHTSWLWHVHAVHHADEHMNVTTAWRHHWLEFPLETVFVVAPFVYVFHMTPEVVVMMTIWTNVLAHFIHLDARISFGRWSWLIANPHNHRVHHSVRPEHLDTNFAAVFPLWDVLFGTYVQPDRGDYPPTGLASGGRVRWTEVATYPFQQWRQMWTQEARRSE